MDLVRDVTLGAGSLAGIFVTSALIAVLVHLKKNRVGIYNDELRQIQRQTDMAFIGQHFSYWKIPRRNRSLGYFDP